MTRATLGSRARTTAIALPVAFFFSSRRRHTRYIGDWSSDVCSSDLLPGSARIFTATEESLSIAEEAGVPIQIAHLQMNGPGNAGRAGELLEVVGRARRKGVDVRSEERRVGKGWGRGRRGWELK